jgi:hypothetical protein
VLTQSLSDQETQIMMGSSDTDFAAQPLGPPESSTRPTSPVPVLVLLLGLFVGLVIGGLYVVFDIRLFESAGQLYRVKFGSRFVEADRHQEFNG